MRTFILATALLSSTAFAACPNLVGKYTTCRSATGQMDAPAQLEIFQAIRNGIMIYTVTSVDAETAERTTETVKADGRIYTQTATDPDSGITFTQATSASCAGDALNLTVNITVQGEAFASVKSAMTKKNGELIQKSTGTSMGEPVEDTVICQ